MQTRDTPTQTPTPSDTFRIRGRWLRRGKLNAIVIADPGDASALFDDSPVDSCDACRERQVHSLGYHTAQLCAPPADV